MFQNIKGFLEALNRRKPINLSFQSPLRRCLVFWDLLLLGIGGSVDVALYVVLGNVIRDIAGPAVLISMIFGFIVCYGAGLCYAEFASYIPSSGSDYDYIYTSLGEICGFFDGWSVLVASVTATSALAQGAADLLRPLTDDTIYENIDAHISMPQHALLSSNLNIVALVIIIIVTVITAIGVHGSIRFNDTIVVINLLVVAFTFILGLFHLNFDYWSSWDKFAPYGVSGIIKSLPFTIFFYGGFISVTFSTEEVVNPSKDMPRSIVSSLWGIFIVFMMIAFVQCLVIPYNELPLAAPLPDAFGIVTFKASKYIIAVGGFCSCLSSVLTACYANSRLTYVMSRDGLLSEFLSKVNKRTQVPLYAVVVTGAIAGFLAVFVDLTILVESCSLLVLLPYVLLCYAVITIRYKENSPVVIDEADSTQQIPLQVIDTTASQQVVTETLRPTSRDNDSATTKQKDDPPSSDTVIENSDVAGIMEVSNKIMDIPGKNEYLPLVTTNENPDQPETDPNTVLVNVNINEVPTIVDHASTNGESNGQLPIHDVSIIDQDITLLQLLDKVFANSTVKFRVKVALGTYVLSVVALAIIVRCSLLYEIDIALLVTLLVLFAQPVVVSILVIWKTPYVKLKLPYTMPCFPTLPLLCLGGTVFVMIQFSLWAWVLTATNTILGIVIYFCYGIKHSKVQNSEASTVPKDQIVVKT